MKICSKCNTENPSKATHCMKCGALLVDEYQLSEEEKLQRTVQEQQKEIDLLKEALDNVLKNKSTGLNLELEKERDALKEENEHLNGQIDQKENEIKDLKGRIKTLEDELSSYKYSVQKPKNENSKLLAGKTDAPEQGEGLEKQEADNTKRLCPHCGNEIAADATFCKYCGRKIIAAIEEPNANSDTNKKWCKKCGAELMPTSKFCPKCGAKQDTADQSSGYVDLGLPSGTLWKDKNESALYDYDAAVKEFGCKLPTKEQLEELKKSCQWTWTGDGYKVTGPNGNFIVLPAAGTRNCYGDAYGVGSYGLYWSSTPYGSGSAWSLGFYSSKVLMDYGGRCDGLSVRLVQD